MLVCAGICYYFQRGRDHGLAPYTWWRQQCGLSNITSFPDLDTVMTPNVSTVFSALYKYVLTLILLTQMFPLNNIHVGISASRGALNYDN